MKKRIILLTILMLLSTINIFSKTISFEEIIKSKPESFINDYAKVFSPDIKNYLENLCIYLQKKSTIELAVVTLPELKNYSIEEAAVILFEKWGIGVKGKDNGLLFIFSLNPRRVRIEVGYGLEGVIPDSAAGRILDNYTLPYFKKNLFEKGALLTVLALIDRLNKKLDLKINLEKEAKYLAKNKIEKSKDKASKASMGLIFLLLILFVGGRIGFLPFLFLGFGGGSYYGGNDSFGGGSFGGFGGGMSGGGGASRGF